VSIQVKTTITRYQPLINRAGRNSLGSRPSHAISIKSNAIHRGELPLTLSSQWTEDQRRNTIIKLPKTPYNSFSKVLMQLT